VLIEIELKNSVARSIVLIVSAASCALLGYLALAGFVVGTLTDERAEVRAVDLLAAARHFPRSARLHARVAGAVLMEPGGDVDSAEFHARQAVLLSPNDYLFRLLLASIEETRGDRGAALESLRAAASLAPNNIDVHWRLANLLLREGKLAESLPEFRRVNESTAELLQTSIELIWRASGSDAGAIDAIVGPEFGSRLALAQFLLKQGRPAQASDIFRSLDRQKRVETSESSAFIGALVAAGHVEIARAAWLDSLGGDELNPQIVWNGSFELPLLKEFAQFDWNLSRSEQARTSVDTTVARSGSRSLKIDFTGKDTTRLDQEVKQFVLLRPSRRYRLECYVRTEGLDSPEGPRVVLAEAGSGGWVAASDPIRSGTAEWQALVLDFTAPATASDKPIPMHLSVKRRPRYSYDDPTKGTIWFDDFAIAQQQ
jgi:tetratricopeptide (TPR) repeat protein